MRVLVVGTLPRETERVALRLADAGHDVVRCHDEGYAPFPCAGIEEGRQCPLEEAPVDVVVTARDRPWPRPSPFEDGAVCGIRQHVPLVVVGATAHPFGKWMEREVDPRDDIVRACEQAAVAPLREHSEIATTAARDAVNGSDVDADAIEVTVCRRAGRLHAAMRLPAHDKRLEEVVSIKVLAALRRFDSFAHGIDVSLV